MGRWKATKMSSLREHLYTMLSIADSSNEIRLLVYFKKTYIVYNSPQKTSLGTCSILTVASFRWSRLQLTGQLCMMDGSGQIIHFGENA